MSASFLHGKAVVVPIPYSVLRKQITETLRPTHSDQPIPTGWGSEGVKSHLEVGNLHILLGVPL